MPGQQEGYRDAICQRNVAVRRTQLRGLNSYASYNLPRFIVSYPITVNASGARALAPQYPPFVLDLRTMGLSSVQVEIVDADTGIVVQPGEQLAFGPGGQRSFFLRLSAGTGALAPQGPRPYLVGAHSWIDVVPYIDGRPVTVDGVESGVRFELVAPRAFLPLVLR